MAANVNIRLATEADLPELSQVLGRAFADDPVMVTTGGSVTFPRFGNLADRGHTFSVPHKPTGITGTRDSWARRAAPQRPRSFGLKNSRPRGIVPCGIIATMSPAANASSAAWSGASEPVPRSTRMPPMARAKSPTTGASKTSFLPRKRTGRPRLASR